MSRFDQTFKDEVRAQNDIVDVISSYVKLERKGNRFAGLCPFHGEKSPSFSVNQEMQVYHCFGCKASGDVFKFIQERERLTFFEALVFLAKRARIPLPKEERSPEEEKSYQERRGMLDALDLASRFFHSQLMGDPNRVALNYLLERGLTEDTIRQFRLGWAPGYGRLYQVLRSRFHPDLLVKAGLILPRREGGGYMDAFYERVMFPITDLPGRVIGFGGRILQGNAAKYKNTSDTPLFTKRHVLFGLSQAKEAMRTKNQAILVEGYMDVIMPHQYGISNVVAPLGTALTDEQCKLLRAQAEQVIVAFDADVAGQMATLRGLEKLYDTGCDVRVLRIPDGKDPDEYIRAHGVKAFEQCVAQAVPLVEFRLRLAMGSEPNSSPEAKARALEQVAKVLVDLKNDLLREEYVHRVANELAGSPAQIPELKLAIDRQMNRLLRQGLGHNAPNSWNNMRDAGRRPGPSGQPGTPSAAAPQPQEPSSRPVQLDLTGRAEYRLLYLLLQNPHLLGQVEAALGEPAFSHPWHGQVFAATKQAVEQGHGGALATRVLDLLVNPDARRIVMDMAARPLVTAHPEQEAADCIENIKKHRVLRRIEDLNKLINATAAAGETVEPTVLQEFVQLQTLIGKKPTKS